MNGRRIVALAFLFGALIGLPGCGDSSTPPQTDETERPAELDGDQPKEAKQPPANAAAALQAVVEGFKQGDATAIWEFLPASHQQEINGLAREFAFRMDPELWKKTSGVARNSAGLLQARKQSFLSHPAIKETEWAADGTLSRKWDGLVALLATVADSELADLEKMKLFDGRKFFQQFDAAALAQLQDLSILLSDDNPFSLLREMIDGASVEVLKTSGKLSTVGVTPKGGEMRKFDFIQVEGKWLPKSWARELVADVRRAKSRFGVELAPSVLAQKKKMVMPYLNGAQEIINSLQAAKTDEAFHAIMTERVIKPAMLVGATGGDNGSAPVDLSTESGDVATIIVSRELTSAEIDQMADTLLSGSDTDRELTDENREGRTLFVVSPVKDLAAFARTITFGKVTKVDGKRRTIAVDVPIADE